MWLVLASWSARLARLVVRRPCFVGTNECDAKMWSGGRSANRTHGPGAHAQFGGYLFLGSTRQNHDRGASCRSKEGMVGLARVHLEGLNVAWERSRGTGRASQCSTGILAQSENKFGTRREAVNLTKHHETTSLTHGMVLGKCPRVTQMAVANKKLFVKSSMSQTPLDCQWSHKEQKIPNLEYKIFEVPRSGLRTPRKYQNKMEKGGKCFLCRNLRLRTFRRVEIVLSETVFIFFKPQTH